MLLGNKGVGCRCALWDLTRGDILRATIHCHRYVMCEKAQISLQPELKLFCNSQLSIQQGIGNQLLKPFTVQPEIQHPQASSKIEKCLQRNCLLLCLQKAQTAHQRSKSALVDCLAEHLVRVYCNEPYASFAQYYGVSQLQRAADQSGWKKSSFSITGGQQRQAFWQVPSTPLTAPVILLWIR